MKSLSTRAKHTGQTCHQHKVQLHLQRPDLRVPELLQEAVEHAPLRSGCGAVCEEINQEHVIKLQALRLGI